MPTRRRVLAAAGTAFALGGCQGLGFGNPDGDGLASPSGTETPPTDGTETPPPGGTDTPRQNTSTPDSIDVDCPNFTETDRTNCAGAIPPEFGIRFEASNERFEPTPSDDTTETITFTLSNQTANPFTLNPHAWALSRLDDESWIRLAAESPTESLIELPRDTAYRWVLSLEDYDTPDEERTRYPTVAVEDGVHAFAVDGWIGNAETAREDAITVELIALFAVDLD